MKQPLVGDIFEIPLSEKKKAFGQYIYWDRQKGPLISVYNCILSQEKNTPSPEKIITSKPLFPPVITGLQAAVKSGLWKIIGHASVQGFTYPGFVSTAIDYTSGNHGYWYYWDGEKSITLGKELPEEYQRKEFLAVYSPFDIAERIETGKRPYEELILTNKMPQKSP